MKQTLSPRIQRAVRALMNGPIMRENMDAIVGCSNGPELVAGLRRKGLEIPCERVERYDKDGNACYPGQYSLTPEDKQIVKTWFE
jgi:hypothetical protein